MRLLKRLNIPFNPYFFYPFLVWVVVGAIMLMTFDKQQLFTFINSRHHWVTDELMYRITWMGQGEVIIPVLLLVMAFPAYRNWWYLITAAACNLGPLVVQRLL